MSIHAADRLVFGRGANFAWAKSDSLGHTVLFGVP
jgi:hypothetical protein